MPGLTAGDMNQPEYATKATPFSVKELRYRQSMLESATSGYAGDGLQDDWIRHLCVRRFEPWLEHSHTGLEVGCSDGRMTEFLAARISFLDVVEATKGFMARLLARNLPNVTAHHSMIEEYNTGRRYNCIFATWVLTHCLDPVAVLRHLKGLLAEGGRLFIVVPNARAMSRQLARHMGLLDDLYNLTPNDIAHGHLHSYDRVRLNSQLAVAGLETIAEGGLMLKPLADYQMDGLYASGMLDHIHREGLAGLGREYPDFCGAIYSICEVRQ